MIAYESGEYVEACVVEVAERLRSGEKNRAEPSGQEQPLEAGELHLDNLVQRGVNLESHRNLQQSIVADNPWIILKGIEKPFLILGQLKAQILICVDDILKLQLFNEVDAKIERDRTPNDLRLLEENFPRAVSVLMQEFLRVLKHKHIALLDKVVDFLLAFARPLPFVTLFEHDQKILGRSNVEITVKVERFGDAAEVIGFFVNYVLRRLIKLMKAVLGAFFTIASFEILFCARSLLQLFEMDVIGCAGSALD